MTEHKLSEEEMAVLTKMQSEVNDTQFRIGQYTIQKTAIESDLKALEELQRELFKTFSDLTNPKNELLTPFYEKYGDGEVDLATGIFKSKV